MKTILKYPFKLADEFTIKMPVDAEILAVQVQTRSGREIPCIWALVNSETKATKQVKFRVIGTGHAHPDEAFGKYIGTFQLLDGAFVGHLFVDLL